jgi:PAS domain S-box-containing protein
MRKVNKAAKSETQATDLRKQAEKIARETNPPENIESMLPEERRILLHELRVHQIELEMQNEELQRAQAELDTERARYFDLYDLAPAGYMTVSKQGLILEANLTAATMLGVSRSTLFKALLTRFIIKEDQDIYYRHRKELFETGEPQKCELRMIKKDETAFWAHLQATAAQDADGAPVCRIVISDITERKRAERALRESEERYRNAEAIGHVGNWEYNLQTKKFWGSDEAKRIYGFDTAVLDFSTEEVESCIPERERVHQALVDLIEAEKRYDLEFEIHPKNSLKPRTISSIAELKRDEHGNRLLVAGFIQDITERKQAEKALRESEELFRSYLENAPDGVYMNDLEGNFLYGNHKCEEIIGYKREELIGKNFLELNILSKYSLDKAIQILQANSEGNSTGPDEVDLISKEGRRIPLEINTNIVQHMGQRIVLSFARDITDRKLAEKNLQDTLESLRKAMNTTIQVMVSAVESRDPYTAGHQTRSADLARAIATEMGLPRDMIDGIRMAGSIHDIGKLSIPSEILTKPTKLTKLEFSLIKEHAQKGYEMLKNVESPWPLAQIVYQHHERMDGSGYPRQLKGEEIIIEARILAVADVVEAMASHRPYRPSLRLNPALEEIENNKGTLYDTGAVDACLRLFREKGFRLEGE